MSKPNKHFVPCRALVAFALFGTVLMSSCASDTIEVSEQTEFSLMEGERESWDALAVFLTGVFTVANADSFNSAVFIENFRSNYDWIKDIFLPHLLGTAEHAWWKCDEYCIKAAKLMANGDKEREKELRELLARHQHHESEHP